jgi:hypothetical protein
LVTSRERAGRGASRARYRGAWISLSPGYGGEIQSHAGEPADLDGAPEIRLVDACVHAARRIAIACEALAANVDQPKLRDSVPCVKPGFHVAIVAERAVGHLDDQQNVGGPRQPRLVEIRARLEQSEIRLRR